MGPVREERRRLAETKDNTIATGAQTAAMASGRTMAMVTGISQI
jgi:hypothetical protein